MTEEPVDMPDLTTSSVREPTTAAAINESNEHHAARYEWRSVYVVSGGEGGRASVARARRGDDPTVEAAVKTFGPAAEADGGRPVWSELDLMRGLKQPSEHVMPLLDWSIEATVDEFGTARGHSALSCRGASP